MEADTRSAREQPRGGARASRLPGARALLLLGARAPHAWGARALHLPGARALRLPGARALRLLGPLVVLSALAASPALAAPTNVVATVGMLGDVASEVAGGCATVRTMMGPGVDPHLYRASAGDVALLGQADLILYSGLHLEGKLGDVLAGFAARTPTVAVAEQAVPPDEVLSTSGGAPDPHVWMDVGLWRLTVPVIEKALLAQSSGDEECASGIPARAAAYEAQLAALDAWARAALATVPERQRVLVTAHDAFHYFGRAYGVQVEGIQGVSTESEAAVADIRRVADLIVERGVPAIFVESTINQRTVNAVIDAVKQRGGSVGLGGELYSDAMGAAGSPDSTYIGMLVHNVTVIATALGGQVPALPEELSSWQQRWQ